MVIKKLIFTMFVCGYFSITSNNSIAATKHFNEIKRVSLKCYVNIVGGGSSIVRHHNLPVYQRKVFEDKLIQNGMKLGGKTYGVKKILECVDIGKRFVNTQAAEMEKKSLH